jgi:hypothetical protein
VDREELPIMTDIMELGFLGSGFPLFYNFIIFCILLLFEMLTINGGYNLVTNVIGTYCFQKWSEETPAAEKCPTSWMHQMSLANKLKY